MDGSPLWKNSRCSERQGCLPESTAREGADWGHIRPWQHPGGFLRCLSPVGLRDWALPEHGVLCHTGRGCAIL